MPDNRALDEIFTQRPAEILAELRDAARIHPVASPYGDGWLVTGFADVDQLLADSRLIQNPETAINLQRSEGEPVQELDPMYELAVNNVAYRDRPEHTRLRRLVSKAFTPSAVERLRPKIEEFVDRRLDEMEHVTSVELIDEFCQPVPMFAISEILGIPETGRHRFAAWARAMNGIGDTDAYRAAVAESSDYIRALIQQKRISPGQDVLSDLIAVVDGGDRLSEIELVSMALLIAMAGFDTTAGLIANSVIALLEAPDQLSAWLEDPGLLPVVIEELLRFTSPVNISLPRYTTEPVIVGDVTLPRGSLVLLSLLAANQDGDHFADADRLDFARSSSVHVAFGRGIHYCIGAPLARLEAGIALTRLFQRFPEIRLAAEPKNLARRNSILIHTVATLPVELHP